jgi:hypothetical protein
MGQYILKVTSIFLLLLSFQGAQKDCANLPGSFKSYNEACLLVRSSSFKLHESVNTSKSSWIRGADFYSCDGKNGFMIITTERGEYIHQGVPIKIWNEFKEAGSLGSYYTNVIKSNYRLLLNIHN